MLRELINILVSVFGILMSIGHFPMAYKIYKTKYSKNISLFTYFTFFIGSFLWLVYGIILGELPIVISFIIGVVGSFSVLFLAIKYK